jgi:ketosteroid isomerase-like protein
MIGGRNNISDAQSSELRRRVHDIMRCRVAGDFDRMMAYFSPDVVVYYTCSKEGLFRPGVWRGRDAFRENMRLTDIVYEPCDGEIKDVLVDGDRAAVRWRSMWRHVDSGREYTLEMAHFLHWENDRVVEVHEFLDVLGFFEPIVASLFSGSLDDLIAPPESGLERGELVRRVKEVVKFPVSAPEIERLREICSPAIVCEFVGDRARIPYSGRHVGVQALIGVFHAVAVEFGQLRHQTNESLVDGNRVAMRRTVVWRHHGTGRKAEVYLADFARIERGKIVELIEYRDSVTLLQMQGERETACANR